MKSSSTKILQISFIALTLVALSGCGGSSSTPKTTTDERTKTIENTEFSLKIPREWDVIEKKDFTNDVQNETVLVLRNNVKNENFSANVSIVKKNLQKTEETLEFAKKVINRQKNLLNYKQNKQDLTKMTVAGKPVDSYTMTFEGKKDEQSDLLNFFQTYAVKGNYGYIVTGAYSRAETGDNTNAVQEMVKSFGLK